MKKIVVVILFLVPFLVQAESDGYWTHYKRVWHVEVIRGVKDPKGDGYLLTPEKALEVRLNAIEMMPKEKEAEVISWTETTCGDFSEYRLYWHEEVGYGKFIRCIFHSTDISGVKLITTDPTPTQTATLKK